MRQIVGRVLYGADEEVAAFVRTRMPVEAQRLGGFPEGGTIALGIVNADGKLVAGVVGFHFRKHECAGAVASDDASVWTPAVLRRLFRYPFVQKGYRRLTAYTGATNIRMQRLLRGVGFKLEGRLRHGLDGQEDLLVFGLLKEECRFLPKECRP